LGGRYRCPARVTPALGNLTGLLRCGSAFKRSFGLAGRKCESSTGSAIAIMVGLIRIFVTPFIRALPPSFFSFAN
jgi:hypothetical protein